MNAPQLLSAVEHRQALPRIEDEWNAGFGELARMLDHALAAIRRDDAELDAVVAIHLVLVREIHRARMEGLRSGYPPDRW